MTRLAEPAPYETFTTAELARKTNLSQSYLKSATQRRQGNILRCISIVGPSGRYVTRKIEWQDFQQWREQEKQGGDSRPYGVLRSNKILSNRRIS